MTNDAMTKTKERKMAWMTSNERRRLFQEFFLSENAVGIDDYAKRWPKHRYYVRGLVRGTHYALETIGLAYGLFLQGKYDPQNDVEQIRILHAGCASDGDIPAIRVALERMTLVLKWRLQLAQVFKELGD